MIVEFVVPVIEIVDVDGYPTFTPKYLRGEAGPLFRWEMVEEFDPFTPAWRMRVRLYTDDPSVLGRLRAKPDTEEV